MILNKQISLIQRHNYNINCNDVYITIYFCDMCNYNCWYCYNNNYSGTYLNIILLQQFIKSLKHVKSNIYIDLVGGEPSLHPNLLQFCQFCQQEHIFISIYTNFSLSIQLYNQLINYDVKLVLTYHGKYKHQFLTKLKNLNIVKYTSQVLEINIMYDPREYIDALNMYDQLYNDIYKECVFLRYVNFDTQIYNDKTILNEFYIRNTQSANKEANTMYYIKYNDNTFDILTEADIHLYDIKHFKSFLCDSGKNYIYIDKYGYIYPCSTILNNSQYIRGNIYKHDYNVFNIFKPIFCPVDVCVCNFSVKKQKVFK